MTQLLVGVHPDADAVSEAVANRMAAAIIRTLSKSDYAHICITGGRGGHGALANLAQDAGIDWSRVHVWWSDERFLAMGDEQRNDTMAHAVLLDVVGVPVANVHSMPSPDQYADVGEAARAYVRELAAFGDPCPAFCISVLGMGEDGHVASLFPEHAGLADERVAFAVTDSPKPPRCAFRCPFHDQRGRGSGTHRIRGGKADAVGLLINDPGPLAVPAAGARRTSRS